MEIIIADKSASRLHVKLAGRMDSENVARRADAFRESVAGAGVDVILDMAMVGFMASVGMRLLLEAARRLDKDGARLVLVGPTGMVAESLRIARLGDVIPTVETLDEAVAILEG